MQLPVKLNIRGAEPRALWLALAGEVWFPSPTLPDEVLTRRGGSLLAHGIDCIYELLGQVELQKRYT